MSNILRNNKIKELQKTSHTGHCTHILRKVLM